MPLGLGGERGAARRSCILGCMVNHIWSIILMMGVCVYSIYKHFNSDKSDKDTIPPIVIPPTSGGGHSICRLKQTRPDQGEGGW